MFQRTFSIIKKTTKITVELVNLGNVFIGKFEYKNRVVHKFTLKNNMAQPKRIM